MVKSIKVKPKKRGRPATGKDPLMAFRASPIMRASVVKWAENQPDEPTLSEAIRRLVESALERDANSVARPSGQSAAKAKELAAKAIDGLTDAAAPAEEQASRKRRLLKGPEEFRE